MSDFLADVRARARATPRTIVFPECGDPRTIAAVESLLDAGIVRPVLVADGAALAVHGRALESLVARGARLERIDDPARRERTVERLLVRRAAKGMTAAQATEHARSALMAADAMVALGEADGCVAGAAHTTADVMRAALWLVGAAPGVRTVSSAFYMVCPPFRGAAGEVLTFTDCAVVPYPTAEQLADIAVAAAADRTRIVGDEARVALLSFSTRGSGPGPSVDAVRAALAILRDRNPELAVDGELQGDAALIRDVGERKAPGSSVAGRANVLVFPSLDAGNIAYKLVQRIARASAIGPIVQGLARPCSDLSRGAVADDIINVAAITALQAGGASPRSS
jgi:phosphate acetyltransferase